MKDIKYNPLSNDIELNNTSVYKFQNLVAIQLGSIGYNPLFGIDIAKYILDVNIDYPIEALESHIVNQAVLNNLTITDINISTEVLQQVMEITL